nr:MAG TPA: hypothetical protein [Caudoviricetes sp.]
MYSCGFAGSLATFPLFSLIYPKKLIFTYKSM